MGADDVLYLHEAGVIRALDLVELEADVLDGLLKLGYKEILKCVHAPSDLADLLGHEPHCRLKLRELQDLGECILQGCECIIQLERGVHEAIGEEVDLPFDGEPESYGYFT